VCPCIASCTQGKGEGARAPATAAAAEGSAQRKQSGGALEWEQAQPQSPKPFGHSRACARACTSATATTAPTAIATPTAAARLIHPALVDEDGGPLPAERRRKWADEPANIEGLHFDTDLVYTIHAWQHVSARACAPAFDQGLAST
jgi:hypothetical protein